MCILRRKRAWYTIAAYVDTLFPRTKFKAQGNSKFPYCNGEGPKPKIKKPTNL